jgi:hypothetical protein
VWAPYPSSSASAAEPGFPPPGFERVTGLSNVFAGATGISASEENWDPNRGTGLEKTYGPVQAGLVATGAIAAGSAAVGALGRVGATGAATAGALPAAIAGTVATHPEEVEEVEEALPRLAENFSRALTPADLGVQGTLEQLTGTFSVQGGVATVRVDMIRGMITNPLQIINNLADAARAYGATSLNIEGTLANERLYNILVQRYGAVTVGGKDIISIPLN